MGWRDTWYPFAIDAMRSIRGDSSVGDDGAIMPRLIASDGIAMLGQVSGAVVNACRSFDQQINKNLAGHGAMSSAQLDDGIFYVDASIGDPGPFFAWDNYIAGAGTPGAAYRRSPIMRGPTFEPWIVHDPITGDETALLSFLRSMIGDWQRCVDAAANMIATVPTVSTQTSPGQASEFLAALRGLCVSLDVLRENPPVSSARKIRDAALEALRDTEEFAGKAAADIAGSVGQGAGLVAHGFFSEAGVTSLVVAGIAVWLWVK